MYLKRKRVDISRPKPTSVSLYCEWVYYMDCIELFVNGKSNHVIIYPGSDSVSVLGLLLPTNCLQGIKTAMMFLKQL